MIKHITINLPLDDRQSREMMARWRAIGIRDRARSGAASDRAAFAEHLRNPGYPLTPDELAADRAIAADMIEIKAPRGAPADPELPTRKREVAQLFVILTEHLGVPEKEASHRLAEAYQIGRGTVREWISQERARLGPDGWQQLIAEAPHYHEWLDALWFELKEGLF